MNLVAQSLYAFLTRITQPIFKIIFVLINLVYTFGMKYAFFTLFARNNA